MGATSVYAQRQVLIGKISDHTSRAAISNAYVSSAASQTLSNSDGIFQLSLYKPDTIEISHIGYESISVLPKVLTDTLHIYLNPSTTELKAITILDYMTEETLKNKVLETPVVESEYVKAARDNALKAQTLFRMGYRTPMTEVEKFQHYLKGPQGVTFFSSSGGGLLKALRSLANNTSPGYPSFNRNSRPAGLRFIPLPVVDSVAMDSTKLTLPDSIAHN